MSCEITRGFGKGCNDSIGGVKEIYFGDWSTITTAGITYDAGGSVDGLPTATIFKYVPHQNTANWVEETTAATTTTTIIDTVTIILFVHHYYHYMFSDYLYLLYKKIEILSL